MDSEDIFGNQDSSHQQFIEFQPYDSSMINITMISKNKEAGGY